MKKYCGNCGHAIPTDDASSLLSNPVAYRMDFKHGGEWVFVRDVGEPGKPEWVVAWLYDYALDKRGEFTTFDPVVFPTPEAAALAAKAWYQSQQK